MNRAPDTRLSPADYAGLASSLYQHLSSNGIEIGVVRLPAEAAEVIRRRVDATSGDDGQPPEATEPSHPSRLESGLWVAAAIVVVAVAFLIELG